MMVMVVTGHLGCGVEGLRGRRLSGPRPGWATAIKYPPQPLPPLVRWAPTRQGPHLTLKKQQVGWVTRVGESRPSRQGLANIYLCASGSQLGRISKNVTDRHFIKIYIYHHHHHHHHCNLAQKIATIRFPTRSPILSHIDMDVKVLLNNPSFQNKVTTR